MNYRDIRSFFYLPFCIAALLFFALRGTILNDTLHLLAAQLINDGKRPYLDFFYQHTPIFIYTMATWMKVFGENWRSANVLSALLTSGSVLLISIYAHSRFRSVGWAKLLPLSTAIFFTFNILVLRFATAALPYAICIFLSVCMFFFLIVNKMRSFWAGLCAGAAAASSFLALPLGPIALVWIYLNSEAGERVRNCVMFLVGAFLPFSPVLWLGLQSPHRIYFDLFQYHFIYRRSNFWGNVYSWDVEVLTSWLESPQAVLLALFAFIGFFFVRSQNESLNHQREIYLIVGLITGLVVFSAITHPTIHYYFVLPVPFLSILAGLGISGVGSRLFGERRYFLFVFLLAGLYLYGSLEVTYGAIKTSPSHWRLAELTAEEVNRVATRSSEIYCPEQIYFITGRTPPQGLENHYATEVLPDAVARSVKVMPQNELTRGIKEGRFVVLVLIAGDSRINSNQLKRGYKLHKQFGYYQIWVARSLSH